MRAFLPIWMLVTGAAVVGTLTAFGCGSEATGKGSPSLEVRPPDEYFPQDPIPDPLIPTTEQEGGITIEPHENPNEGDGGTVQDARIADATNGGGSTDAATDARADAGRCPGPIKAGDLRVVEFMVASRSGSGDDGEWIEILNASGCTLDVNGVTIDSPKGASVDSVTIGVPTLVAPGASFLVADNALAAKNHALPGALFSWQTTDTLKNDGDTVIIHVGAVEIDRLTYPKIAGLPLARTLTFPAGCSPDKRSDFTFWSYSFREWTPGFLGTPGAANTDVLCKP